jgi:hypothetical protein
MTDTINQAKAAVRNWRSNHPDGGAKPTLDMRDVTFGMRAMFADSVVIVDGYTRDGNGPHTIHVRFACDQRRTTFPVTLEQLKPLNAPNIGNLVH